jgi:hypothetical protein
MFMVWMYLCDQNEGSSKESNINMNCDGYCVTLMKIKTISM